MSLGGKAFEKGKRGPNEPKVTLFTIGTDFLASRFNVTINERVLLKGSKHVLMGQKSYFLLIKTYFLEHLRPERSPAARHCACFSFLLFFSLKYTHPVIPVQNILHGCHGLSFYGLCKFVCLSISK